jgi:hypothetical protein
MARGGLAAARALHQRGGMTSMRAILISMTVAAGCGSHAGGGGEPDAAPIGGDVARLRVRGAEVVAPDGAPIVLHGYSWGQWGTAVEADAADNAAQGANSVRLPLRWWGQWKPGVDSRSLDASAPGHIDPAHLAQLDQYVAWAGARHLWVILFVDSNYGQGAMGSTDNFWTDAAMKQQYLEVWQFLATHYRDTPSIGAYELLAEPMPPGVADAEVKAFYDSVIPVVRAIDTRTPLIVGPNADYNLHRLDAAYTTADANLIYTGNLLKYDPSKLPDVAAFIAAHQAPVWIDQIGIQATSATSLADATDLLTRLHDQHVGWAWWTYREQTASPMGYAIYYEPSPGTWMVKADWFALLSQFLP